MTLFFRPTILCAAFLAAIACSSRSAETFRAGAYAMDVTPEKLPVIVNGGFFSKMADTVHDRLHARCLVLDDGTTRVAIAVVDSVALGRELIDQAKDLAHRASGIPTERMLVSATHTHSAPSAMAALGTDVDEAYAKWLPARIAEGIVQAAKNLEPARVGWAAVDAWAYTNCRRWILRPDKMSDDPFGVRNVRAMMHPGHQNPAYIGPAGPIDPGLSILSVQARDGRPLALLANFSQHYFGAPALSADFCGRFSEGIGKAIGARESEPAFVGILSQGTSGDSQWMDYNRPKSSTGLDEYSAGLIRLAADAYRGIKHHEHAPLAMAEAKLTLRRRVPDAERLASAKKAVEALGPRPPSTRPLVYAREQLFLAAEPERELKLQALRIGGLGITAIPNEVFAITGLKLKAQSPLAMTFNIGLANGEDGYIPPPEQHHLGGYTTWPARTAGLEVEAEPRIVETLLGLLEKVAGEKRRPVQEPESAYAQTVLAAKPLAYWRFNEIAPPTARDATGRGFDATYDWKRGIAFYLPGVGSALGASSRPSREGSVFAAGGQINRAPHLAGGSITAAVRELGANTTVSFWFWNGLEATARETTGILFKRGVERLGITGRSAPPGRLFFGAGEKPLPGKTELLLKEWHHVALVREGARVTVFLDGRPEILSEARAAAGAPEIAFGPFEGRIDEAAVFTRALPADEIAKLAAGAPPRGYTAPPPLQPAPANAGAPKFPAAYAAAVQALQPVHVGPVREPKAFAGERVAVTGAKAPSGAFSVSMWFRNDLAAEARPVTGYFFSRGADGDKEAPGDHLGLGGNLRPRDAGRLLFFNGNARGETLTGRTVLARGSWHHVVLVRDGRRVIAYLDGRSEPELSGEAEVTAEGARDLFLGARSDRFAPLLGSIAEFVLFDRALQPAEVSRLYQAADTRSGSTPPAAAAPSPGPLSAAESLKKIHVPAGYEVELVAAEPLLLDPVAFDWDAQGRLWVVEMADYPLGMDGQGKSGGRVRILSDSDGDGRYDRSTLFADGLNFPNGILTWRDGCLITAAPEVVFLKDLDGDGVADLRRPLLAGFQEGNQQLRVNGLRWGLDGWVYCANGGHHVNYGKETSITSLLTGERVPLGSRDFRFKPDTGEIDPLSGPSQFGRNRDAWGHWFGEQNSFPVWHYVLEDRYLRRNPHVAPPSPKVVLTASNPPVYPASPQEKRYHSFAESGRFTSACSAAIYLDTLLFGESPDRHSFTCEPFHNVVQHLIVADDGASFSARRDAREKLDFFASEDRWCRPVMTRTGPDGALWVADMYRFMIEHPQFLTPAGKEELMAHYRAGDDKGRIYRVFPAGRRPPLPQPIDTRSIEVVVSLLSSSNGWLRDQAQMILAWRGDQAAAPLLEKTAMSGNPLARLHALHALATAGALRSEVLLAAFRAPEPELRASAVRLAESSTDETVIAAAAKLAEDRDAKVRLQLALSLGAWKDPASGDALAKLASAAPEDAILRGAIMSSAPPHLAKIAAKLPDSSPLLEDILQTALGEKQHEIVLARLQTLFAPEKLSGAAGVARLGAVLALLHAKQAHLGSLAAAHPGDDRWAALVQRQAELFRRVKEQLPSAAPADQGIYASLLLSDPREAPAAIESLGRLVAPGASREELPANIRRLAQTNDDRVPRYLLEGWEQRTPAERDIVLDALMGREAWLPALLAAVRENKIARSSFDAQRQARLVKHPAAGIRKLAGEVFAAASTRQQVIEAFRPALALRGDTASGEKIFANICSACHQHGSVGKPIGPDLRSVLDHPPEKLLRSILDPSADIQPGFTAYFCELRTGEQLYGIVVSETGGSVTLKLPDGTTRPILRNEIKTLQSSRQSLMPEGLEATLTPQTIADLIAFLKTP